MKKLTLLLLAVATVLTLSQCKKKVEQIEPAGDMIVPITLDVKAAGKDSKINVDPNDGTVSFEQNDVVYVGSGGKYVGKLTCRGTKFVGNLTNPVMNEPLYFYFLGNRSMFGELTPDSSTECSFDIMDQTDIDNMPVVSSAISEEDFTGSGTYHGFFQNKGALVMFNVETASTTSPTIIEGMKNFVTVDFVNNTLSYSEMAGGAITLPAGSGERWAILLPQNALAAGNEGSAYSSDNAYTGTRGAVPAIVANGYYVDGISVKVTTPNSGGTLEPPTNVHANLSGSNVLITWNDVDDATYYKVFKANTWNGMYELLGMTFDTYYEDEYPDDFNYYKVCAANSNGESAKSNYAYYYNPNAIPEGAINRRFTINANGDKVYFSNGNLLYKPATGEWAFAWSQYLIAGSNNNDISPSVNLWIDLFGWGTSGWNNGNTYYQPYDYEYNGDLNTGWGYGPTDGSSYEYDLTGAYAQADWGVHNAIENGGNQAGLWRTLTAEEFSYLLNQRTTATGARFAKVTLEYLNELYGKYGLLLLPDDWDGEYFLNTNSYTADNVINSENDFNTLQSKGVVFLPCAGRRININNNGPEYQNNGPACYYWTSTHDESRRARYWLMDFSDGTTAGFYRLDRMVGCSVRLVQDVQ